MSTQPILITDDKGYADHKLAYYHPEEKRILTLKVRSVISPGHGLNTATGDISDGYSVVAEDGSRQKYTCSEYAHNTIDLRHGNYPLMVENRVLFTHALATAGLLGKPLEARVTIPYADYFVSPGEINKSLLDKIKENFNANNVEADSPEHKGLRPNVVSITVSPEAISAWFDWAMDEQGKMNQNFSEMVEERGTVLIVDVGGSTTDIVAVSLNSRQNLTVHSDRSGTRKVGVIDLVEDLEQKFLDQLRVKGIIAGGHESVLTALQKEQMLTAGRVRIGGERHDVTELRAQCARSVASEILNFIRSTAGETATYHSVVVVGGGSVVFRDALSELLGPGAEFLDEFSNARGALKLSINGRNNKQAAGKK